MNGTFSESEKVWEQCFQRQYPDLFCRLHSAVASPRSWRTEFINCHSIGRLAGQQLASMSPKFHQTAELSTEDFTAFDDLLLGQNPERDHKHLYLLDHLLATVRGRGDQEDSEFPNKNLTVKFYAHKVLRHVQHRLLMPKIAAFLESEDLTSIINSGHR